MKRILAPLLLLAACAAPPGGPVAEPADPGAWYQAAAERGMAVYQADPHASLIAVTVRRGGPFSRLGHDHVVASRRISGFAAPEQDRADFAFHLDEMTVDEPALRERAGLPGAVQREAIIGTRVNMLGPVLEAQRYPRVLLRVRRVADTPGVLRLTITLHGVTRSVDVPATLERGPDTVTASGHFTLRQTDFGITPMSVLGGALVVQDAIELDFRVQARRLR